MGIEEEAMQAKGTENICNKIAVNLPNFGKEMVVQVQRLLRLQIDKTRRE
jgi:hypothetical protein